jgi:hypothetical protein
LLANSEFQKVLTYLKERIPQGFENGVEGLNFLNPEKGMFTYPTACGFIFCRTRLFRFRKSHLIRDSMCGKQR